MLSARGKASGLNRCEITQAEILDWWDDTRNHVQRRCSEAETELVDLVTKSSSELTMQELINPVSKRRKAIQGEIEARIRGFEKVLTRELEISLQGSLRKVEHCDAFGAMDWVSAGFLAASGASAVGALGLAVGATGLATVSMPAFVFFSTTAFSWPLFAA